jgi:hypothetical protein
MENDAMPPKRRPNNPLAALLRRTRRVAVLVLGTRRGRTGLLTCLVALAFALVPYLLWREIGEDVLSGDDYQLRADRILVTPEPDWIRSDVRAAVLRDGSLDEPLSIVDDDLTERIAAAFSQHAWVQSVRVTKHYPARVVVDVVYRRPVAMVEVQTDGNSLLPVDVYGVVLPGEDFSPLEAAAYPRVAGIQTVPLSTVGTAWGDGAVEGAARIAAAIGAQWRTLRLDRIVPVPAVRREDGHDRNVFHLHTGAGTGTSRATRIVWGHAPGEEVPGEMTAQEKIGRLAEYVREYGSLDEPEDGHELDLRDRGNIVRHERAALRR